jgi:hypothetical protein
VDSSNCCIPSSSPLVGLFCPLPSTTRGDSCVLDGCYGNGIGNGKVRPPLLLYGSGRLVVVRELNSECPIAGSSPLKSGLIQGFVYRVSNSLVRQVKERMVTVAATIHQLTCSGPNKLTAHVSS